MSLHKCIFDKPASRWEEAVPLGNGRIGACVFGGTANEKLSLNEESLWSGGHRNRNNPDALKTLPKVRELLFSGRIREAEKLMQLGLCGCPPELRVYQTLGDLIIGFEGIGQAENYRRVLDMENGICTVSFEADGSKYIREYFATNVENLLAVRLRVEGQAKLSFNARLERWMYLGEKTQTGDCAIAVSGKQADDGMQYYMQLEGYATGGRFGVLGQSLVAENCDEAVLLFGAATSFNHDNPKDYVGNCIFSGKGKGFEELLKEHRQDFSALFNRTELRLNGDSDENVMIPELFEKLKNGDVPEGLAERYFDFGRYLMISGSRPGTLPLNLQGIWNKDFEPAWGSKYTININAEMNYWPAETCNLSECQEPLFDLIERMVEHGRTTAREMYGCRGFVAHHNTDIWGDTAPQDLYIPASYWVMGAAWLCTHQWTHYLYTLDVNFLKKTFPIMCEAAEFFVDFLVEHDGYMVTCPSVSPENTFILPSGERGCNTYGVTMDNQILRDLFTQCLEAAKVLGESSELLDKISELRDKLRPSQIASDGTLMEWDKEYDEAEPGHRHISHLYGLYPSSQINVEDTPELAAAASKTLEKRLSMGGGHTGWSCAWIINLYARLKNGEKAYANLKKLFTNSTLPNLFDNHPPFQIDGNFGATAAMVEMLVQARNGKVFLLPALPEKWSEGSVKGIRIPGNCELDMEWKELKVSRCRIKAFSDFKAEIFCNGKQQTIVLKAGEMTEIANV